MYAAPVVFGVLVLLLCPESNLVCGHDGKVCKKHSNVSCPCGDGKDVQVPVEMCQRKIPFSGLKTCEPCDAEYVGLSLCEMFKNCKSCDAGRKRCSSCPPGRSGHFCTKGSVSNLPTFPLLRSIRSSYGVFRPGKPVEGEKSMHHIRKRYSSSDCPLPRELEHTRALCTIHEDRKNCRTKCLKGAAPQKNAVSDFYCKNHENIWKPYDIKPCKLIIDCSINLQEAGFYRCYYVDIRIENKCKINCYPTEQKAGSIGTYICGKDHVWHPPLPDCAVAIGKD